MKNNITIDINDDILENCREQVKKALALTAYALQDIVREAQVIPRDTGALQDEKFFVDTSDLENLIVHLVFEGPYARRLYYHPEYNFRKDKNPNAQALWMTLWEPGGIYEGEVQELFQKNLDKVMGGDI